MTTLTSNNSNNTSSEQYPIEQSFRYPLIITALLVLIPALLIYNYFGQSTDFPRSLKLFFGNWISPIILWFFCASFLHLYLKKKKLNQEKSQSKQVSKQVISSILSDFSDNPEKEDIFETVKNNSLLNTLSKDNLMRSRLMLFLNHKDNNIDETFAIKERELLKGSFALPRFMVWAIPILGFIGTVWGISNGIAHFSGAMADTGTVTDVSSILKDQLPLVTNSLATAFDTTLLALLLSIPLMMFMLTLEKSEEAYLIDIDERWFHDIKPLLPQTAISNIVETSGRKSTAKASAKGSGDTNTKVVANEIKQLSTQIKALQETMEDLYETVFTSKLGKK